MRQRLRFSLRVLLAVVFLVAVALGALVASRDRVINRSSYSKIRPGMSEAAVEELLEGTSVDLAPLNYEDVTFAESREALLLKNPPPHKTRSWKSGGYMIPVIFDKNGRVASKYYQRAPDVSIIDRIADWLGI